MKFISWNVNGIRACAKKGLFEFIKSQDADFYCFQETKITAEDLEKFLEDNAKVFADYDVHYNCATKRKGYSGVLILAKKSPLKSTCLIDIHDIDYEGRIVATEYENFILVNTYFPHSDRDMTRIDYKMYFNENYLEFVHLNLPQDKPKVLTGDFNVAHNDIDLARPKQNVNNPGFTQIERTWFDSFLKLGYVDTFRQLHPQKEQYTWWSYLGKSRERNVGWRIDYFVVSADLVSKINSAEILDQVTGSDHCPVLLELFS